MKPKIQHIKNLFLQSKKGYEVSSNHKKVALLLTGWLAATDLLAVLTHITHFWPAQVLLFICISFLPGVALMQALRIRPGSFLEGLLYSFGLGVLVLMLSGLAANQILHGLGVARPLELAGILGTWNIVTILCIAGAWTNRQPTKLKFISWPKLSKTSWTLILSSALLPMFATFGAFRLNNGGDAAVAGGTIVLMAGVIGYSFLFRNRLHDNALAWCIFMVSLSILLMTSLRSWDITGHDIAREFRVYSLTHLNGHWDIGAYRDPYNACLSITILPEVFAKLLNISGLISFKLILQVIFAVCSVVIYLSLRRHVSKLGALVGCVLFVSYPTFINDSAMLTRQGVAYLFFALALLAAMRLRAGNSYKLLFLLFAFGVIVSHYSTSYMFVAIFAIALGCKIIIEWIRDKRLNFRGSKLTVLSPAILAILGLTTFLWYAQVTATSGGLATTLSSSVANIPHLLSDDNKSSDTSASLLMAAHKSQVDIYQSYLFNSEITNNIVDAAQYRPNITSDDIPITSLGKRLSAAGVQPSITLELRQHFAKLLQLLALISVCYAVYLYMRKKTSALPLDLLCLSLAGIALLIFMVVLPNLSLNYGVLRTFQQSLVFLIIPLVIFLAFLGKFLWQPLRVGAATISMVVLLFLFTGFFAQILGGVSASLPLNNRGLYYGLYYTTEADKQAYAWIKQHIPEDQDVRAASHAKGLMHDPNYPFEALGILPTQKPTGSYVYLGQAQQIAHKFYVYYEGSPLITTFPINYRQSMILLARLACSCH